MVGLISTKWLQTYWHGLLQSQITGDLGQRCKVHSFLLAYPTFQLPPTLSPCKHKPFIKSIKFYLFRYKYWLKHLLAIQYWFLIQFEQVYTVWSVWRLWSGLYTSTHCSRLVSMDRNGKLLKLLPILKTALYFKDRNWISKSVYCISCSVVCKIVFAPNFPIFRITLAKSREEEGEEEHRQLQNTLFHANSIILFKHQQEKNRTKLRKTEKTWKKKIKPMEVT